MTRTRGKIRYINAKLNPHSGIKRYINTKLNTHSGYVGREDFEAIQRRRAVDGPQSAPQRLALRPPEVCELAARIYAKRLLAPTVNASFCILSSPRFAPMHLNGHGMLRGGLQHLGGPIHLVPCCVGQRKDRLVRVS